MRPPATVAIGPRAPRHRVCAAIVVVCVSWPSAGVRADGLRDVARRVEDAWKAGGAHVTRHDTRFVMEDEVTTVDIRPAPGARTDACRRVALLGARGMSFHVLAAAGSEDDSLQLASAAGVVELSGCGGVPDWVKLKTDSGRGAVETVTASASFGIPSAMTVLLERTGGVLPSAPEPGSLAPLAPPASRATLAQDRLRREGFEVRPELTWTAGEDGKGGGELALEAGCHRIGIFASEPRSRDAGRRAHLDLDGALRRADGDVLVEDQTIAPDVRLDACVATTTKVSASFEGAPRRSAVIVTHGKASLPPHLPTAWGPEVRARMASAILEHHTASPHDDAVFLAQGGSGPTPIPLELEPGACYLAVAALERGRGRGRGLSLRAVIGERSSEDDRGAKDEAAIIAFCALDARRARLEVEVRTSGSGWGLAVYRMGSGVWSVDP